MPGSPRRRGAVPAAVTLALTSALTLAAVLAAVLAGPVAVAVAATPSATPRAVDRVVKDKRVAEASGLAVSLRHPGVLWTHNDSGNSARLYGIGADGSTVAAVKVTGVEATDWEAVAAYRDAAGRPMLAIADTGDNRAEREDVEIVVLREPALTDTTARPERVLRLRYPAGPADSEALLVDPDGKRAFLVTKGFGGALYQVPEQAWAGRAASGAAVTLVRRAGVPLLFVTDGVMGPGGHPLLRTYSDLAVLPPVTEDVDGGSLRPLAELRLPRQAQGESLTLRDGRTALVGSEGKQESILRVTLPPDVLAVLGTGTPGGATPGRGTTAGTTGGGSPAVPASSSAPDQAGGGRRLLVAGLLAAVVGTALMTARARRGGRRR